MKEKVRISFLGDIMFEKYSLNRNPEKTNFKSMLEGIKPALLKTDILIGNVETTFSGKEAKYTSEMYSFNTPDKAIDSLKEIGLDYATLSNNHILDRGFNGRARTIDKLQNAGIKVLAQNDNIDIIEYSGLKFSILPYTSTTNFLDNEISLTEDEENIVRLLCPYNYSVSKNQKKTKKQKIFNFIVSFLGLENTAKLFKIFGKNINSAYEDNLNDKNIDKYINRVKMDIEKSKDISDFTIIIPHMGGQFNINPGDFSKKYMEIFSENNADFVIGSHPHIIQEYKKINNTHCFYSIGNVSMAQNSTYIIKDNRPDIGIIVHLDFDVINKENIGISLSAIKISESKNLTTKVLRFDDKIDGISLKSWLENRLQISLELDDNEFVLNERKENEKSKSTIL